jgi:hypothetical protein
MKNQNYYLKKSIELSEEAKKTIIFETSIIFDYPNDIELGKEIRKRIIMKLDDSDQHIKHIQTLIDERKE